MTALPAIGDPVTADRAKTFITNPKSTWGKFWYPINGVRPSAVLLDGGWRTGKTRNVCEYLHLMAVTFPGFRALMCRKTRSSLTETTLQVLESEVMTEGCAALSKGGDRTHRTHYRFPHGTKARAEIVIGGCEEWSRIMGGEYDVVFCDEATEFTRDEVLALRSRLSHTRGPFRQLVMACNPSYPHHWLNQTAQEWNGTGPVPEIMRITSFLKDNPAMYDPVAGEWTERGQQYNETSLKHLSGVFRRRMVDSVWASSEGLVYEEFQPDIHSNAILDGEKSERLVHFGSADYGWDHPLVLQCWGHDAPADGCLYLRREWCRRGVTNDLTFAKMVEYSQRYKFRIWLVDPSAKGFIEEAKAKTGLDIRGANNDVPNGIQLVKQRLNAKTLKLCADYQDGHDSTLHEHGYPENLSQSFQSYEWKEGGKDEPEKKNDDQADACRYMVNHLDAGSHFRWSFTETPTITSPPERTPQDRINAMFDDDEDDGLPESWWR